MRLPPAATTDSTGTAPAPAQPWEATTLVGPSDEASGTTSLPVRCEPGQMLPILREYSRRPELHDSYVIFTTVVPKDMRGKAWKVSRGVRIGDPDFEEKSLAIVSELDAVVASSGVYWTLATRNADWYASRGSGEHGEREAVSYSIGVGLDIDSKSGLTSAEVFDFLKALPVQPCFVTETSPGGFQPVWIREAAVAVTPANCEVVEEQNKAFEEAILSRLRLPPGAEKMDRIGDLPRVLRCPGSRHRKASAVLSRLVQHSGRRISEAEIRDIIASAPASARSAAVPGGAQKSPARATTSVLKQLRAKCVAWDLDPALEEAALALAQGRPWAEPGARRGTAKKIVAALVNVVKGVEIDDIEELFTDSVQASDEAHPGDPFDLPGFLKLVSWLIAKTAKERELNAPVGRALAKLKRSKAPSNDTTSADAVVPEVLPPGADRAGESDERVEVFADDEPPRVVDETTAAIAASGSFFSSMDHREIIEVREHAEGVASLPVTADRLADQADRDVRFVKIEKDGEVVPARQPRFVAGRIKSRGGGDPFRRLKGISSAPTIINGRLIRQAGFDPGSQIYFGRTVERYPEIPLEPTQDDAIRARDEVLAPFDQFPFQDNSRDVLLSLIMTGALRFGIDGSKPGFLIRASTPGDGKTLGAQCAMAIATGRLIGLRANRDEVELTKAVTAALRAGEAFFAIDNVAPGVPAGSPALAAAITSRRWSDRILGTANNTELPFDMIVVLTGNSVVLAPDMGRRVLPISIDSQLEAPDRRVFKIANLASYVLREHRRLLMAALVIAAAYDSAERPGVGNLTPFGSFEEWEVIRRAIIWAGGDDPCRIRCEEIDEARVALKSLHAGLDIFDPNGEGKSLAEIFSARTLNAHLAEAFSKCPTIEAAYKFVATLKNRIFNGRRFVLRHGRGGNRWVLEAAPERK